MTREEHGKIITRFLYKVRGISPMQEEVDGCWDLVKSFAADIDAKGYEKDVFEQWPNFKDVLSKRVKMNQKARWN